MSRAYNKNFMMANKKYKHDEFLNITCMENVALSKGFFLASFHNVHFLTSSVNSYPCADYLCMTLVTHVIYAFDISALFYLFWGVGVIFSKDVSVYSAAYPRTK